MKLGKDILIDALKIWKTPPGEAIWSKVIDPETKFDAAGVHETRMKFTPEREEEFLPQLEEWYEAGYQQVCQEKHKTQLPREKPPWKKDKDGRVIVKFNSRHRAYSTENHGRTIRRNCLMLRANPLKIPIPTNCESATPA